MTDGSSFDLLQSDNGLTFDAVTAIQVCRQVGGTAMSITLAVAMDLTIVSYGVD